MQRTTLSLIYRPIDALLGMVARFAAISMILLVLITVYDVSTRYLGVGKFSGLNSTMVQESEYWAHAFLFTLFIGYGYTRQVHVRIDLIRDFMPGKVKFGLELFGILFLLIPLTCIGTWYCFGYAVKSFVDGEVSPSTNGLSHFWILKSTLVAMFGLLWLAGVSQALKCIDGIRGLLDSASERQALGGGH